MKYLYLYRHAEAIPADDNASDHERILSEPGIEACHKIGNFLKNQHLAPHAALVSSAVRTKSTFQNTMEIVGATIPYQISNRLYLASPAEVLKTINELGGNSESLMVVAHNPGLHQLCLMLAHSGDAKGLRTLAHQFPPASLALLSLPIDNWEKLSPQTGGELVGLALTS